MPERTILKVGLVGCGNVAVNDHAPALRQLKGVERVAVADPVASQRRTALSLLDLPPEGGFPSHLAMLETHDLDYVVLAVPPAFRREIVADCAARGVHVLSEKPLATRPVDAQACRQMMDAAGLKLGMVHNYLYYPEYVLLRKLIQEGAIGKMVHVALNFLGVPDNPGAQNFSPNWRHDPIQAGGGVLMDMIHAIYLAEFLADGQVQAVSAAIDNLGAADIVEDIALVQLTFDRAYATVSMGWGHGPGGVEVSGSEGRILIFYQDYGTGPFSILDSFTLLNSEGRQEFQPRDDKPSYDNFLAIHQDFAEAVRDDRMPRAPAKEGCRALEATLAAYESAVEGRVVPLPLPADSPIYKLGVAGLKELIPWSGSRPVRRGLFGLKD